MNSLFPSDPSVIDGFVIEGRLGSGGFGVVYAARAEDSDRVALKVLRPELSDDKSFRERLAREAEALSKVQGDRTATVRDVVTDGERVYLVMDLVDGLNIDQYVAERGALTGEMLWSAAEGLSQAIRDIHAVGIVHRDLKPSNIMYGPDGVKVLDFGISMLADRTSLTQTGQSMGTSGWMAPEVITGQAATNASDVFNLGLILFFLATGRHVFGDGPVDAIIYQTVHSRPDLADLPSGFGELIGRCLDKDPSRRPSLAEIHGYVTSRGAVALPAVPAFGSDTLHPSVVIDPDTDTGLLKSRRPVLAGVAILAVAAIVGVIIGVSVSNDSDPIESISPPDSPNTDLDVEEVSNIEDGPGVPETEMQQTAEEQPEDPTNECVTDGTLYYVTADGTAIDEYRASGECDVNCKFDNGELQVPIEASPVTILTQNEDPYDLDRDNDGFGCDQSVAPSTVQDEVTTVASLEEVLLDVYVWGTGSAEKTIILQEALGVVADGNYGAGTRQAHLEALAQQGLSTTGVPTQPETTQVIGCSLSVETAVYPTLKFRINFTNGTPDNYWVMVSMRSQASDENPDDISWFEREYVISGANPVIDLSTEAQSVLPLAEVYIAASTRGEPEAWEAVPPHICVNRFFFEEFEPAPVWLQPFDTCQVQITGFQNNNYTNGVTNTWEFDFRVRFPFVAGLTADDVLYEWIQTGFSDSPYVNYVTSPRQWLDNGQMSGEQVLSLNLVSSSWSGGEEFIGTAQGQFESVAVPGDAIQIGIGTGDFEYEWGNGNIESGNCETGATLYIIP